MEEDRNCNCENDNINMIINLIVIQVVPIEYRYEHGDKYRL